MAGCEVGGRESELDARLEKQVQETTLHLIVCNDVQYKMLKSKNVKIQYTYRHTHIDRDGTRNDVGTDTSGNVLQFSFA